MWGVLLYIHTHGKKERILCKNSYERNEQNENVLTKVVHFDQIIQQFKDENCKNLINKPKLVFFDCFKSGESKYVLI